MSERFELHNLGALTPEERAVIDTHLRMNFVDCSAASIRLQNISPRWRAALEKMTPMERWVMELSCNDCLTHAEIAKRLNQPKRAVRTWMKGAFKAFLDERGGEGVAV